MAWTLAMSEGGGCVGGGVHDRKRHDSESVLKWLHIVNKRDEEGHDDRARESQQHYGSVGVGIGVNQLRSDAQSEIEVDLFVVR